MQACKATLGPHLWQVRPAALGRAARSAPHAARPPPQSIEENKGIIDQEMLTKAFLHYDRILYSEQGAPHRRAQAERAEPASRRPCPARSTRR